MTDPERKYPLERPFAGKIRPLDRSDIPGILPILQTWFIDSGTGKERPDEIEDVVKAMEDSLESKNDNVYLVAHSLQGEVIGMIGLRNPEGVMRKRARTHNPAELINAYVAKDHRDGKGVGTALVAELEIEAVARGYTELILNSGPRHEKTGWGFYDKLPGYERQDKLIDFYGKDAHAEVWSYIFKKEAPKPIDIYKEELGFTYTRLDALPTILEHGLVSRMEARKRGLNVRIYESRSYGLYFTTIPQDVYYRDKMDTDEVLTDDEKLADVIGVTIDKPEEFRGKDGHFGIDDFVEPSKIKAIVFIDRRAEDTGISRYGTPRYRFLSMLPDGEVTARAERIKAVCEKAGINIPIVGISGINY